MIYTKLPGTNGEGHAITVTSTATLLRDLIRTAGSNTAWTFEGDEDVLEFALPSGSAANIRFFADGNTPTSAVGQLLSLGEARTVYGADISKVKLISTGASSVLDVAVGRHSVGQGSDTYRSAGGGGSSSSDIASTNSVTLVADNAAAPGTDYPLPVGGTYNAVDPTYSDGDRTTLQTDVNGKLKVSGLASGGSSSSGSTSTAMIGSDLGAYTFDASAQTVTISGTKTFAIEEILSIINVTDQVVIYSPSDEDKGGTIASNVLTLEHDTTAMADTDDLQIFVQYDNSQDYDLGQDKVGVQNPEWAHYTSIEHIIDEANVSAATYRKEFTADGYRNFSFHLNVSGGITTTIWATNDDTTDETADTGWIDVSSSILGSASLVDSSGIYFVDTDMMPLKWMIKYVASDATNAVDAWIRKY